jgi:hypothetical protein
MLGASEDAHIDVFGRDMAIYHTSNDNLEGVSRWSLKSARRPDRWDGNAICNFGHHFSCRAKGRRCDFIARVPIDDYPNHNIHRNVTDLKHEQCFGKVFWVLELADEAKESDVSSC